MDGYMDGIRDRDPYFTNFSFIMRQEIICPPWPLNPYPSPSFPCPFNS